MHGKRSRVRSVGHNREDVLKDVNVVRLIESLGGRFVLAHILQELVEDIQTGVGHIAHRVLESPDDRVQDELELSRRKAHESRETVIIHGLKHQVKVGTVLWVLFKVFVDHVERTLEDGIKDLGDVGCRVTFQFVDNGGHRREDFRLPSGGDGAVLIVAQDSVEEWRNKIVQNQIRVVGPRHPIRNELECLLLDQSHALDE